MHFLHPCHNLARQGVSAFLPGHQQKFAIVLTMCRIHKYSRDVTHSKVKMTKLGKRFEGLHLQMRPLRQLPLVSADSPTEHVVRSIDVATERFLVQENSIYETPLISRRWPPLSPPLLRSPPTNRPSFETLTYPIPEKLYFPDF
jgi:hypothetical protein